MIDDSQILEFNRIALEVGENPISITENAETEGQEVTEIVTEPVENIGVSADFEISEILEWGVNLLGGKVGFSDDENKKISSASNKVLNFHGVNAENLHPYTNAILTGLFIAIKHKGTDFFNKIKNKFTGKNDDTGNTSDTNDNSNNLTGVRDKYGRIKL